MASDDKPTKKTARQMMVFARKLNEKLPQSGKAGNETTRVGYVRAGASPFRSS